MRPLFSSRGAFVPREELAAKGVLVYSLLFSKSEILNSVLTIIMNSIKVSCLVAQAQCLTN